VSTSSYILVVGGAGYIGSHMVLALQQAGYQPLVYDNLSTGHAQAVLNAKLIVGELSDTRLLNQVFTTHDIQAVMHFASLIDVAESSQKPLKYYENNVGATLNLFNVMLTHGVKPLIFSSSAAVYGQPLSVPILESHPLAPINPYGRSKWMVEEIIKDMASNQGLHYSILRYFNAAGADPEGRLSEHHDPESHLIPLILQVAAGLRDHIHVYGNDYATPDGTCIRDFIHVTDICQAHLLALQALLQGHHNTVYNLGTSQGHSVLQVIHTARELTTHPIPIVHAPKRPGDPSVLVADATRAMQELQWRPKYPTLSTIIQHAWQKP